MNKIKPFFNILLKKQKRITNEDELVILHNEGILYGLVYSMLIYEEITYNEYVVLINDICDITDNKVN